MIRSQLLQRSKSTPSHIPDFPRSPLSRFPLSRFPLRSSLLPLAVAVLLAACGQQAPQQHGFPPAPVSVMTVAPADAPVEFEYVAQTAGSREVEIRARVTGILMKRNYTEGLRDIRTPMCLVAGGIDALVPPEEVRKVHDLISSEDKTYKRFSIADGAQADYGHGDIISGRTAPGEVYPFVSGWLEARATPRARGPWRRWAWFRPPRGAGRSRRPKVSRAPPGSWEGTWISSG